MWKSVSEMFSHTEGGNVTKKAKRQASFVSVLLEMCIINIVFSFDSILTAVGLSNDFPIMIASIIVSSIVMLLFARKIGSFLDKHKSLKVLALSFILMIGLFLILEASHIHVPKAYIYVAIAFSLFVEVVNIKIKNRK